MITKKTENSTLKDVETVCENGKKKGRSERVPTKVVVRRLPPSMTKETFLQQCSPLPSVDYLYFVQADMSLAPQCFSRAYLNFLNHQDIFTFTQKFDNYVFVDAKGQEFPAVVEFAPFQRIPKRRPNRKKDPKMGSIESSPIFIAFKDKLETEIQENKSSANSIKQHFFETSTNSEDKKEVTSTPLLDFIKTRKAERQRIRDEKREEKRKRDLERRRAKDEMRKSKKDEESPVVKHNCVLSGIEQAKLKVTDELKKTDIQCPVHDNTKQETCPNRILSIENLPKTNTAEYPDPNMPKVVAVDSTYQVILDGSNNIEAIRDKERKLRKIKERLFLAMSKHPLKNVSDSCNNSIRELRETFPSNTVKLRNELNGLLKELNITNNSICATIVSRRNSTVVSGDHNNNNNNNNINNNNNNNASIKIGQNEKTHQTLQESADLKFRTKIENHLVQVMLAKTVSPLTCATFGKQIQSNKNADDNSFLNSDNKAKDTYENGRVQILKPFHRNQITNGSQEITESESSDVQTKCSSHQVNDVNVNDNNKRTCSASNESRSNESPLPKVSIANKIFSHEQIVSYNSKLRNLHSSGLIKTSSLIENSIMPSECETVQNGLSSTDKINSSITLSKSVGDNINPNQDKKPVLNSCNKSVSSKADEISCVQDVERENNWWQNSCTMTIPRRPYSRRMYISTNSIKCVSGFQKPSKVLHGSTYGKEKPKDKEINKNLVKKRSDEFVKPLKDKSSVENRSRENRGRVGKSYQEERMLRQAEKREEQRKKSASLYQSTTTSESKASLNESNKQEKPEKEKEKTEATTEEKPPAPIDNKIRDTDRRKNDRIYNKRDETRRSSQKFDTRRDTDDGRKRGRGPERYSYGHKRDDDKRDDYYGGGRRKPNNDTKKNQEYTSYAEKNRDRLRGRLNQKKTSEHTVDSEKVKNNQEEKSEVSKKDSKETEKKTDDGNKMEISKKESDETIGRLEPEDSVKDTAPEPPEKQLFKLGVKLKMLNESIISNTKNKLKRRNSLESGPNQMKSNSEEQSKEHGSECKRRNSVGSDNYRQKEEHKDQEKIVENSSSVTEKNEENGNSENVISTSVVVKEEICDYNKSEDDGEKNNTLEEGIKSQEKEVPRRRKSMEEKSGELVTAGLENGLLLARRNSLESGELSKKTNDTSKCKSSPKLDKEDAEHRSNKDPRSERRIRNKDRPTMELYRPGMGRFSKQRLEREKVLGSSTEVDSPSSSPSPTPVSKPKFPATAKEN